MNGTYVDSKYVISQYHINANPCFSEVLGVG